MRKPAFCKCENKVADQLRGNREADQCLCFHYPPPSLIEKSQPLAIFYGCTARLVSDLVRNTKDRFSYEAAHFIDKIVT